jgi:hypothetical protein
MGEVLHLGGCQACYAVFSLCFNADTWFACHSVIPFTNTLRLTGLAWTSSKPLFYQRFFITSILVAVFKSPATMQRTLFMLENISCHLDLKLSSCSDPHSLNLNLTLFQIVRQQGNLNESQLGIHMICDLLDIVTTVSNICFYKGEKMYLCCNNI